MFRRLRQDQGGRGDTQRSAEGPRATSQRFGAAPHGVAPTSGLPGAQASHLETGEYAW